MKTNLKPALCKGIVIIGMGVILFTICKIIFFAAFTLSEKANLEQILEISAEKYSPFSEKDARPQFTISPEKYDLIWGLINEPKYKSKGEYDGEYTYGEELIIIQTFYIKYLDNEQSINFLEYRISNLGKVNVRFNNEDRAKEYNVVQGFEEKELYEMLLRIVFPA